MSDGWAYFPSQHGGVATFTCVHLEAADLLTQAPALLAKVKLRYSGAVTGGEEGELLSEAEERLRVFAVEKDDLYVGRITAPSHRTFYVYTHRSWEKWTQFAAALRRWSGLDATVTCTLDPEHGGYWNDLYPSRDEWQVLAQRHVTEMLSQHGDDGSQSRKVEHWIYFQNRHTAADFVIWAENDGYTEESDYCHTTEDGQYSLRLSHHGTLQTKELAARVKVLRAKAAELGGEYDGWEAPLFANKTSLKPYEKV